ncbi:MAG: OsmC family protein [Chitinispirillaceae bacterium]|nr:OsmC family protein [Chitinispirillaceae bacterium]
MEMLISFPGGKRVDAQYSGFSIRTDQPVQNGGEGSAPAPFDLFLASIGTCAGIYVVSFCQHRHIPTENIFLIQKTEENAAMNMIEKITIEINVPADFPPKYKNALVRSAELCSVKKHVMQPPKFSITVNEQSVPDDSSHPGGG